MMLLGGGTEVIGELSGQPLSLRGRLDHAPSPEPKIGFILGAVWECDSGGAALLVGVMEEGLAIDPGALLKSLMLEEIGSMLPDSSLSKDGSFH